LFGNSKDHGENQTVGHYKKEQKKNQTRRDHKKRTKKNLVRKGKKRRYCGKKAAGAGRNN